MNRKMEHHALGAPDAIAAPAGGADVFGRPCRGCVRISLHKTLNATLLVCALSAPAGAGTLAFSGLDYAWHDEIAEAPTYRLRYVTPGLADDSVNYTAVSDDMAALCQSDALPRLAGQGATPQRVVITLMAEPVDFGVMTPGVRQFFESYAIEDGLCIWEAF
ncbi:DUF6497 family protein [Sagittula salina]|uniref:Acetolactate synthase n=1 Tax=Sagittula salina TaxID=2820268 RepID=A0A940MMD7_9RHOB|nr:DUF6497 family protein [Sagittula salina]MBP0481133.1 acetolactate synthase [Sagittula salina]